MTNLQTDGDDKDDAIMARLRTFQLTLTIDNEDSVAADNNAPATIEYKNEYKICKPRRRLC